MKIEIRLVAIYERNLRRDYEVRVNGNRVGSAVHMNGKYYTGPNVAPLHSLGAVKLTIERYLRSKGQAA